MNKRTSTARWLRRRMTADEKELWRHLKAARFAGFKFRRQHPVGGYFLDFYCPVAKVSVELDGTMHGLPIQLAKDETRDKELAALGILPLRFWNRQWREGAEAVLLEIWSALQARTVLDKAPRKPSNNRFVPPSHGLFTERPPLPSPLLPRREERE